MNDTITLPRLAELMAEIMPCEYEESEKFIKNFFAHIEDALAVSDEVNIDGLGTFSRNSDPSQPIKYQPADSITEALNKPFEMFEPVAIGNADLNAADDNAEANVAIATTAEPPLPSVEDQPENNDPDEQESPVIPEPPTISTPIQPEESQETDLPIILDVDKPHTTMWIILAFILGLLIGAVATYFCHEKIKAVFSPDADLQKEEIIEPATVPQDDLQLIETIETDSDFAPVDSIMATTAISAQDDEQDLDIIHSEIYDTVTPERFLTTMARQYYGQMEYWVFIYEANADVLGNPNRIKPGTRVIIPDKSEFSEDETNEQILSRAKRMSKEIYDRY